MFAFAVAAATVALASAAFPNPAVNFNSYVFLNVTHIDGISTILNGQFNQDTFVFAGSYADSTGYTYNEVYTQNAKKQCTNWNQVGSNCILGCNAGSSCSGHSCTCGAANGIFAYLAGATASGSCGPAGAGTAYTAAVSATDDDYHRAQSVTFCFVNDTPLSISKTYASAGELIDEPLAVLGSAKGGPIGRIATVNILFNTWSPLQANPKAFIEPSNCSC